MSDHPNSDLMTEPAECKAGAIYDFLTWLQERPEGRVHLAVGDSLGRLSPCGIRKLRLIQEYLGVDPVALEQERRNMVKDLL